MRRRDLNIFFGAWYGRSLKLKVDHVELHISFFFRLRPNRIWFHHLPEAVINAGASAMGCHLAVTGLFTICGETSRRAGSGGARGARCLQTVTQQCRDSWDSAIADFDKSVDGVAGANCRMKVAPFLITLSLRAIEPGCQKPHVDPLLRFLELLPLKRLKDKKYLLRLSVASEQVLSLNILQWLDRPVSRVGAWTPDSETTILGIIGLLDVLGYRQPEPWNRIPKELG